jgi:hypothetical protein
VISIYIITYTAALLSASYEQRHTIKGKWVKRFIFLAFHDHSP